MMFRVLPCAIALVAFSTTPLCAQEPTPLRVGIPMSSFARNSASEARIAVEVFLKRIFSAAQTPYSGVVYESDEELLEAIRNEKVDLFAMRSELFIASADKLEIRPILVTQSGRDPVETLLLVAKKGVPLSNLKDRTLIIDQSARGNLPLRWISDSLLQSGSGETADRFFDKIETVNSASKALLPVYFGKQDAAILSKTDYNLLNEHNPKIDERLNIVADSHPLAATVLCLRGDFTDYRPHDITDISEDLPNSEDGRRFLKSLGAKKIVPFKEEYLHHNRQIHHRIEAAKVSKEGGR